MASEITINSVENTGSKSMFVDHGVVSGLTGGDEILFRNALESPTRDVDLSFFLGGADADQKKDITNALSGFCTEMGTDKTFEVPNATMSGGTVTPGEATCTLASTYTGTFQYTVTAGNPYENLDPVIIVEGGGARPMLGPQFVTTTVVISVVLIAVAAYVGYRRGRAAGKAD